MVFNVFGTKNILPCVFSKLSSNQVNWKIAAKAIFQTIFRASLLLQKRGKIGTQGIQH